MIKVTFLLRGVELTHKWDIIFENEACNSFGGMVRSLFKYIDTVFNTYRATHMLT